MRAAGGEAPEALWSGSREPWGTFCNVGSSRGSPTHCLPLPQEKRLSTESGLSADSHLSAGTASQGEPEGPLAEEEGLSQQEPVPATQEEVMEETYEEVRLALGAACSGAGLPAPTLRDAEGCPRSSREADLRVARRAFGVLRRFRESAFRTVRNERALRQKGDD